MTWSALEREFTFGCERCGVEIVVRCSVAVGGEDETEERACVLKDCACLPLIGNEHAAAALEMAWEEWGLEYGTCP